MKRWLAIWRAVSSSYRSIVAVTIVVGGIVGCSYLVMTRGYHLDVGAHFEFGPSEAKAK